MDDTQPVEPETVPTEPVEVPAEEGGSEEIPSFDSSGSPSRVMVQGGSGLATTAFARMQ